MLNVFILVGDEYFGSQFLAKSHTFQVMDVFKVLEGLLKVHVSIPEAHLHITREKVLTAIFDQIFSLIVCAITVAATIGCIPVDGFIHFFIAALEIGNLVLRVLVEMMALILRARLRDCIPLSL